MSPHFGLVDEKNLTPEDLVLIRARLHWRCGNRRLREKKTALGIATIYDALLSGMRWLIMVEQNGKSHVHSPEELENERYVFHLLKKQGVINSDLNINKIQEVVDKALMEEDVESFQDRFVADIEAFLSRLKVLPYDQSALPPEDPATD